MGGCWGARSGLLSFINNFISDLPCAKSALWLQNVVTELDGHIKLQYKSLGDYSLRDTSLLVCTICRNSEFWKQLGRDIVLGPFFSGVGWTWISTYSYLVGWFRFQSSIAASIAGRGAISFTVCQCHYYCWLLPSWCLQLLCFSTCLALWMLFVNCCSWLKG